MLTDIFYHNKELRSSYKLLYLTPQNLSKTLYFCFDFWYTEM